MKASLLSLTALSLAIVSSCTLQTEKDPLAPTKAMAAQSGTPLEHLGEGYAIFQTQCSQCHEQRIPNEIPTKQWHLIVPGMAWNAGLSAEEEQLVTEYVIAASKVKKGL